MIYFAIASALCCCLAAICKAAADRMAHTFSVSAFAKWNSPRWWARRVKRKTNTLYKGAFYDAAFPNRYKPMIGNYPVDGWHLANSGMIIFLPCAGAMSLTYWWWLPVMYAVFVLVFNTFYNKIFYKK